MNTNVILPGRPRELTGRAVLICFIAFFAVVASVNFIMVRVAVSTFAGTETDSAYRAGLAYKGEEAAAAAQTALRWTITGRLDRTGPDNATLAIDVRDANDICVSNIEVSARLAHPLNSRFDRQVTLKQYPDGLYYAETDVASGQWSLVVDIRRGRERLYRSVNRVVLK